LWVEIADTAGSSGVQIGCPTGISGLGGANSQVDDTCLDSEEMEYSPGMASPGALTVNLNFDPAVVSHRELWELFENDNTVRFVIGLSDGAKSIVPTFDTAGTPVFPATRTSLECLGYVADLPLGIARHSNLTPALSVQRTGPRRPHWKA